MHIRGLSTLFYRCGRQGRTAGSPYRNARLLIKCAVGLLLSALPLRPVAQKLLQKPVTIEARNEALSEVLNKISRENGFYFSYNSRLIAGDSLVSLSAEQIPLKQALDRLFLGRISYRETADYIILQAAAPAQSWYISGYVQDAETGERLENVSIYERVHLAGTITDNQGRFRLQLKDKNKYPAMLEISVSRVSYQNTAVVISTGYDQDMLLTIRPSKIELETVVVSPRIQRLGVARLFISSRLKKQSANLRNFLASRPYQFSLTPGLGTHGDLGAQVVNRFSFNVLGGYTAGVNGFELAGLFNINKQDVGSVQIAGLFNTAGGNVNGLQVGGLHNKVLGAVKGMQVAGIVNKVNGDFSGLQLSGILSGIDGSVEGMVVAGIKSTVQQHTTGWQIAGIAGITNGTSGGIQISGIYNRARYLKGWQIRLINIADTAEGYSIGLLNINRNGFHSFSLFTNELLDCNIAYKAGNKNLYVLLTGGLNLFKDKAFGLGYGLGNNVILSSRLRLMNELTVQQFYSGNWKDLPFITSVRTALAYSPASWLAVFGGPSLSVGRYTVAPGKGYAGLIPAHTLFRVSDHKGWLGWQLGISSGF